MNWLERARHEMQKSAQRPTAITAERNLSAVTAVLGPAIQRRLSVSNGSIGSSPLAPKTQTAFLLDDFEERAAIMEFDGGLSREQAERAAWTLILNRHRLH